MKGPVSVYFNNPGGPFKDAVAHIEDYRKVS